ncbi:hypothetical protein B0I35DRAFT_440755 [Stachybotrys elegans]|uniref:Uncharacterized protein n=1 Tax=Stachybotrys elegans TaxID=80388 RepID=A0A8K0SMY3_9HYPO|nr:hypothetical protein B0I35DRAFT_440755 [Stachybotrys elegans]
MSTAVREAASLRADIRLEAAVLDFRRDLSPSQKIELDSNEAQWRKKPPTIQDVMRLTAQIDRQSARNSGNRRCFGPRLTNVLQSIQQFAALGDIVLGGSQNIIACSVWALVRMTLFSMVGMSTWLEKLSNLLMLAGCSAPRYERMALLYPQSQRLQSHMSEYFIIVVRICHWMLRQTSSSFSGTLFGFLGDSDIRGFQSELERWAIAIKEEVQILSVNENRTGIQHLIRSSEAGAFHRRQKARMRLLDSCSTSPARGGMTYGPT